jgi:ubiquinone/menaquinone biosynthesis C-methylase UbiE
MRRFARTFAVTNEPCILDVGGTPFNWSLLDVHPRVTIVNMPRAREAFDAQFRSVFADGRALPFPDRSFDIVFSNSVIEHVGDPESQRHFASEIARVGGHIGCRPPTAASPSSRTCSPLSPLLPARWQRRVARKFTVWAMIERPTPDRWEFYIEHYLRDIRLLDAADLRRLFPGAKVVHERLGGLTKSLIAVSTGRDRSRR